MSEERPLKRLRTAEDMEMEATTNTNNNNINNNNHSLDSKALNRFSRQNAALGAETTAKLSKMKVLIIGARGIGVETSKNLVLQGVGQLSLYDNNKIVSKDLGVNFFFTEEDIGKIRSDITVQKLRDLNPTCKIETVSSLDDSILLSHNAVVVTQLIGYNELIRLDKLCRRNNISFFIGYTGGVFVDIFVDHGEKHIVNDFDGERPIQKLITSITQLPPSDDKNEVTEFLIRYETPEGQIAVAINQGSYEITEVEGLEELNGKVFKISRKSTDPVQTLRISVSNLYGLDTKKYIGGGLLTEKKLPTPYPMHSLEEKLFNLGDTFSEPPTTVLTDLLEFGSEHQQHLTFFALINYLDQYGSLPRVNNDEDYEKIKEIIKKLIEEKKVDLDPDYEVNYNIVKAFVNHSSIELQAMAAFVGGVLAQEIVKTTGKFTPIPGFMHFSSRETLPSAEQNEEILKDCAPKDSPFDELASLFGWKFIEKLSNLKYFMVGCGALGCEFMKNFALNNICCGPQGKLYVTDADRIELSNLSRQFLFREHNVGQPKSLAASKMAKLMNKNFNIEAMEIFVGPKSEDVFNDEFWLNLDGVCNALDNIEARLYVDRQCVKYEKSLLESGTMGTSGNVDVVCPFKTRTYSEGGNAAEGGGIPMCTLRNFPHLTDHCIEWARDQFELLFTKLGKLLESFSNNESDFIMHLNDKAASEPGAAFFDVRSLISYAKLIANPSIGAAAQLAYDIFHFLFRDRILDLQAAFPRDYRIIDEKTKQDKGPFWSEKKRYPTAAKFDYNNPDHIQFLLSTTCLFMWNSGIVPPKKDGDDEWMKDYRETEWIAHIAQGLNETVYVQAPVNSADLDAPEVDKSSIDSIINGFVSELKTVTASIDRERLSKGFESVDFEKDDDLNFHISFITAASNLRCDNYSIKHTDFHSCKVIAGRIIPAIATTTAAVCGLVMLELFKLMLNKDTNSFMNRAVGLGGYNYTSFTADEPSKFKTYTEVTAPNPHDLPEDAFDDKGVVKPEYLIKTVKRAYPEGHTVWDKIICDSNLSLKEFSNWLLEKHNLVLKNWNFIYGYKTMIDSETKSKSLTNVSYPIYPTKPILDYSLLPSLELTLPQASMEIMRNAKAKPTQAYINLWRECKANNKIPENTTKDNKDVITDNTKIKEIFEIMSRYSEEQLTAKAIEMKAISGIESKKFVLIPSSETPSCVDSETGDEIEHLASFKFIL